MLVVESNQRKSCQEVWQTLDALYKECLTNREFAIESNPWIKSKVTEEPMTHSVEVDVEEEAEQFINKNRSLLPVHPGRLKSPHPEDGVGS